MFSLGETLSLWLGDVTETDSVHIPISVSIAANCCEKHQKPSCIVDDNFDLLIQTVKTEWSVMFSYQTKNIKEMGWYFTPFDWAQKRFI